MLITNPHDLHILFLKIRSLSATASFIYNSHMQDLKKKVSLPAYCDVYLMFLHKI